MTPPEAASARRSSRPAIRRPRRTSPFSLLIEGLFTLLVGSYRRLPFSSAARRAMVLLSLDGFLSNTFLTAVQGSFLTGFALLLALNDSQLSFLIALVPLANVIGLWGAWMVDRIGSRKGFVLATTTASRLLWIPMLLLPFLPTPLEDKAVWLLILYAASSLLAGVSINGWQSWISDLVPESVRGRYMGRRNRLMNLGAIVMMLIGGALLDWGRAIERQDLSYAAFFLIALLFGIASLVTMGKIQEPPLGRPLRMSFLRATMAPLRDRNFRRLTTGFGMLHLGLGFSAPFFIAYLMKHMGVSYTDIRNFIILSLVLGMVFHPLWGSVMDRAGIKPAMLMNLAMLAAIPLLYIVSLTHGMNWIYLAWAMAGIAWSGFTVGSLNLSFALSPKQERPYYLAAVNIVSGVMFFAGSQLSGELAVRIGKWHTTFLGMEIVHYHLLFLGSSIMRYVSLLFFLPVRDAKSQGVRVTLTYTAEQLYDKLLFLPNAVRWISKRRG